MVGWYSDGRLVLGWDGRRSGGGRRAVTSSGDDGGMVRPAQPADHEAIMRIAASFGFDEPDSGVEPGYLQWISGAGRLLVAELDGQVVGFGASLPLPAPPSDPTTAVMMICDLFVRPAAHGRGLGRALATELVDGSDHRVTCSSGHPAAMATYRRLGMQPVDTTSYLRGVVAPVESTLRAVQTLADHGTTDRPDLLHHWADRRVRLLRILDHRDAVGHAMVIERGDHHEVARLATTADAGAAMNAVLATLTGRPVVAVVRDGAAAAVDVCLAAGMAQLDSDTVMATSPDLLPPTLVAMHPAFC
jgi:GNAT superfamily N-acetyltransferase